MTENDTQLEEYLDEQFDEINSRLSLLEEGQGQLRNSVNEHFEKADQRFNTIEERFDKAFEVFALKEDVGKLEKRLTTVEKGIENLTSSVNQLVSWVKDLRTEFSSAVKQLQRHDRWIHRTAEEIGLELDDSS